MVFPVIKSGRENVNLFINTIAPLVVEEYLERKNRNEKRITPATVIAQAALESGWNLNAKTLFGIKGEGITSETTEFINGHYVTIVDSFKAYPNIASAIKGYYDLMQSERYDNATNATTTTRECYCLYSCGYATDPEYAGKLISIIEQYNLTEFNKYCDEYNFNTPCDDITVKNNYTDSKTDEELADEVYEGLWGNGDTRKEKLESVGRDYNKIQEIVNSKYYGVNKEKKTLEELANDIILGVYGNGRKERLNGFLKDGYTEQEYLTAQELVNKMLEV